VRINWVSLVRRGILADRTLLEGMAWTAVAVALPALLRFVVDQGESGIPFVTFFPAMLLVSVFLGWRFGAAVGLLTAVVANRLFTPNPVLFYVSFEDAVLVGFYVITCTIVIGLGNMLRDVVRDRAADERRDEELAQDNSRRHRNLLMVVQSLAHLTARNSGLEEFPDTFDKRIWALGRANDLIRQNRGRCCGLHELVGSVTAPFRTGDNSEIEGPDFPLASEACIPLALALHELCSNAARHGALSVAEGKVTLRAGQAPSHDGLLLLWKEQGGPTVASKPQPGAGMVLLRPQPGLRDVRLRFEPGGVECEIEVEGVAEA
jgi:two-component sensor histidine kinase